MRRVCLTTETAR